jgi:signal transduction histidine kinase
LYYQKLNAEKNTTFSFHHSGEEKGFSKQEELIIYRIIMELTNNIIKHAEATEATIALVYEDTSLHLTSKDNGKGFPAERKDGIGLKNIRSRVNFLNGSMDIKTGSQGTVMSIRLPYKAPESETPDKDC